MNTIQSMKQALDVLMFFRYAPPAQRPMVIKAIADLEQAIQQEEANIQTQITKDILRPVKTYSGGKAWPVQTLPDGHRFTPFNNENPWVGLTDEAIDDIYYCVEGGATALETWREQARAIEAKLKEKNSKG
jgi:hypothetical protein